MLCKILRDQVVGAFVQLSQARDPVIGSCPVDEGQHTLLVDFAGGVRVNLARRNGPAPIRSGSPFCLLGLKAAYSNRHQAVKALNRLTDNTLTRAQYNAPFLRKAERTYYLQKTVIMLRTFLRRLE